MPNDYQSIASGSGLLKNNYDAGDNDPISAALRKRADRIKLKVKLEDAQMAKGDSDG